MLFASHTFLSEVYVGIEVRGINFDRLAQSLASFET